MTEEKLAALVKIFEATPEKVEYFFTLEPVEAVKVFSEYGCEVQEEDLVSLAEQLKSLSAGGELDMTALEDVVGGSKAGWTGVLFGLLVAAGCAAIIPW